MSNNNLYPLLLNSDLTAPNIQLRAKKILSHSNPTAAALEWKRALSNCDIDVMLPLVYVANEAVQNAKRQNKTAVLEAIAGELPGALRLICTRPTTNRAKIIEKVRRTCKIWGERAVYSHRFVGEMLQICSREPSTSAPAAASVVTPVTAVTAPPSTTQLQAVSGGVKRRNNSFEVEENVDVEATSFGDTDDRIGTLDIGVNQSLIQDITRMTSKSSQNNKRQRVEDNDHHNNSAAADDLMMGVVGNDVDGDAFSSDRSPKKKKLPKSWKSITEVIKKLITLKSSSTILSQIPSSMLSSDDSEVGEMVGDELGNFHNKIIEFERILQTERTQFYEIANERHQLKLQLEPMVDWIKDEIDADSKALDTVDTLIATLKSITVLQKKQKVERAKHLQVVAEREQAEALERQAREAQIAEEERQLALEEQLKKDQVAEEGKVWNPVARAYQSIHDQTSDSWRD